MYIANLYDELQFWCLYNSLQYHGVSATHCSLSTKIDSLTVFEKYLQTTLLAARKDTNILIANVPPLLAIHHNTIFKLIIKEFAILLHSSYTKSVEFPKKIGVYILYVQYIVEVADSIKLWKSSKYTRNPAARVILFLSDRSKTRWKILNIFLKNNMLDVDVILERHNKSYWQQSQI